MSERRAFAMFDVVTLGETMLRLTPPAFQRLEQASCLEIEVGGSESNLAVGLARLGLRVAWLSRLPLNPLGQRVARFIAGQGVDISFVTWAESGRQGLYFLEEGSPPRGSQVIYDRAGSAFSQMQPEDLPSDLFQEGRARLLHLSGITPALSASAASTALRALELAQKANWKISFDLNYRSRLWSSAQARVGCEPFVQAAHIYFVPLRDAIVVYDLDPQISPQQALSWLMQRYPQATIVLTLGKDGALGCEPGGSAVYQPTFPADNVDRLGSGDAFDAGFLYAYLFCAAEPPNLEQALRWGAAMAALKYSIRGDMPLFDRREVERLLEEHSGSPQIDR